MELKFSDLRNKLHHAIEFAQHQVSSLIQSHPDYFPVYTVEGKWRHSGESWTNWCEGFLGGMMWVFYVQTGNYDWFEKAAHYSVLIQDRMTDRKVHDLGFLFWSTWKRWFDLTGEPEKNDVVITAGQTLGLRFMEKGGYLCSFVAPDSLFIDIMMNVGIVFYAAQQSANQALYNIALKHCLTTQRCLVRGDGSTAHEGIFDLESGEFLRQTTHQGWRGDSTWARGLAWALYGFATAYQMTRDDRFLQTSRMCAEFYLANTSFQEPASFGPGIPPNDYDDPRLPSLPDSSAAAITASGLIDLSILTQDPVYSNRYKMAAFAILDTLCSHRYLAYDTEAWEGILKHGVYHQPKGIGVDESVMWGEYFFVEAVHKALELIGDQEL